MPTFFFHFMRGDEVVSDDNGTPCEDRQEALSVAGAAAAELNGENEYAGGTLVVFDEGGTEIGRISISPVH
jgi:hypothetical protein